MTTARSFHTATFLSNGKVLVAGGWGDSSSCLASAELYDPATGSFTPAGSMTHGKGRTHGDRAGQRQGANRRRNQWQRRTRERGESTTQTPEHLHPQAV